MISSGQRESLPRAPACCGCLAIHSCLPRSGAGQASVCTSPVLAGKETRREGPMRVEFTPSPQLYPFESCWHERGGVRMHYVDEGSGQPILMCHGNPTWSFLYRNVIVELRDRFRCVAVDYPGFGLSDRPDGYGYTPAEHARVVGALVDELGLEGIILMG